MFWRTAATVQLGIDPRIAVVVDGLVPEEQEFIDFLTRERTDVEVRAYAKRHRISRARLAQILSMLRSAGVLAPDAVVGVLASIPEPHPRATVSVPRLDLPGVAVALALARVGIAVSSDDAAPVGPADHPLLRRYGAGLSRAQALRGAVSATGTATAGQAPGEPQLAVVTGRSPLDPERCTAYMDAGTPHLALYAEEMDMCVGPLVEPGQTACVRCLDATRMEDDAAWARLRAQVWEQPGTRPGPQALETAAVLATRAIVGFLSGRGNALRNAQWRIGPVPTEPRRVAVEPSRACGCTAPELRLVALERENPAN